MRIVRFLDGDQARFGVAENDRVSPLPGHPWDRIVASPRSIPLTSVMLLPPCLPGKIIGIGKNYKEHAAEFRSEPPDEPLLFLKPPSALLATGDPIVRPRGYKRVDFEGELAVVIGKPCRRIQPAEALGYVFGYSCFNDVSVRDLQKKDGQWTRAKGFDTFAPFGPWIETELDPAKLVVETRVNGEMRQHAATSEMVFDVPTIVSFVSFVMSLEPGDVIATGTPAGVGNLTPGDVVDVSIAGIGTLHNSVIQDSEIFTRSLPPLTSLSNTAPSGHTSDDGGAKK